MCEYWVDTNECHYMLADKDKDNLIAATDDFACTYLDDMVRSKYENQYKNNV